MSRRFATRTMGVALLTALSVGLVAVPAGAATTWPPDSSWTLNGNASVSGSSLVLTQQGQTFQSSAVWLNAPVSTNGLDVNFQVNMGTSGGADGITLALADPAHNTTATTGSNGGGLGFTAGGGHPGVTGVGVALDTYQNSNDPSNNFVGFLTGGLNTSKTWAATHALSTSLHGTHSVEVTYTGGVLTLILDGTTVLSNAITLPSSVLLGFTGATGGLTNDHIISSFVLNPSTPDLSAGGANGVIVLGAMAAVLLGLLALSQRRRTIRL